jgi:hypothetical protein
MECERESYSRTFGKYTDISQDSNKQDCFQVGADVLLVRISRFFTRYVNVASEELLVHLKV